MSKSLRDQAHNAIKEDNVDKLRDITPSQIPLSTSIDGKTLLMCAVEAFALTCIQYLLDQGADMNECDSTGVCLSFIRHRYISQSCGVLSSLLLCC